MYMCLNHQNARPGRLLICGFLTTLPPPEDPFRDVDEAVAPPTFLPVMAGRRTADPASTSCFRLDGSFRSISLCFSAAARSRSAAIWVSISMRRLNSSSVTRRSRWE
ncbi:uncharacterized protein BDW43DRAFT_111233 [Aspergillus alliaceus]|uniref:uncharacterized protein n=1 Tax=Petromyces alliaceus TaxID=209559 RepID=UPI0012A679B6|nr:uncharacterized protein BDW43DRAFT_111233 [Aspergillus alliaceus]KAB8232245.1 hypothetical protein BDW43DRAFT_111233 [Aspergillus alliaceus]